MITNKSLTCVFLVLLIAIFVYVPYEFAIPGHYGIKYEYVGYDLITNPPEKYITGNPFQDTNNKFNPFADAPDFTAQIKWSQVGAELIVLFAASGIVYTLINKNGHKNIESTRLVKVESATYSRDGVGTSDSIKQALFSFTGRRKRLPYFLINWLSYAIILTAIKFVNCPAKTLPIMLAIGIGIFLGTYIFLTNVVKRMHDFDQPTSMAIGIGIGLILVPLIINNLIIRLVIVFGSLYLLFKKGTDGPNLYGTN